MRVSPPALESRRAAEMFPSASSALCRPCLIAPAFSPLPLRAAGFPARASRRYSTAPPPFGFFSSFRAPYARDAPPAQPVNYPPFNSFNPGRLSRSDFPFRRIAGRTSKRLNAETHFVFKNLTEKILPRIFHFLGTQNVVCAPRQGDARGT